jgi:pimeloyl-ACP methyl ester carboxylesterase
MICYRRIRFCLGNIFCAPRVPRSMKTLVRLLLASQLCLWNVTLAQEPLRSKALGDRQSDAPNIRTVDIGNGITLHYVDQGKGTPVIFVHGSLSDGGYWADQVGRFAEQYRAIAYSRRYNYPNSNPARSGYSAVVDAQDLAAFIHTLHLGKVVVIGHSYGALTALFLAARHPELVHALVLAEPPAVSLLRHLPGDEAKAGKAMFLDIERRMVAPMQQAFRSGDRDAGIGVFIDYVFNDPQAWKQMMSRHSSFVSASSEAQSRGLNVLPRGSVPGSGEGPDSANRLLGISGKLYHNDRGDRSRKRWHTSAAARLPHSGTARAPVVQWFAPRNPWRSRSSPPRPFAPV